MLTASDQVEDSIEYYEILAPGYKNRLDRQILCLMNKQNFLNDIKAHQITPMVSG